MYFSDIFTAYLCMILSAKLCQVPISPQATFFSGIFTVYLYMNFCLRVRMTKWGP